MMPASPKSRVIVSLPRSWWRGKLLVTMLSLHHLLAGKHRAVKKERKAMASRCWLSWAFLPLPLSEPDSFAHSVWVKWGVLHSTPCSLHLAKLSCETAKPPTVPWLPGWVYPAQIPVHPYPQLSG